MISKGVKPQNKNSNQSAKKERLPCLCKTPNPECLFFTFFTKKKYKIHQIVKPYQNIVCLLNTLHVLLANISEWVARVS